MNFNRLPERSEGWRRTNVLRLRWVYLAGFFLILALPLLNLPPTFSPPDWGKTILFRIILSILIFLFLYQLLQQTKSLTPKNAERYAEQRRRFDLAFWFLIALLGVFLLATVFSLDARFSFWGSPYRSGGFLNFAFYIILAILAFLILRERDWQKIWDFAIFIGILVSSVAIFQWQGWFSEILIPFSGRPPATVGGPIFLAIYLLLLSFLILSFLIKEKWGVKKVFYLISFLFFVFVAIFITQTRAAMIGFAIGLLFFIIFYPVRKPSASNGAGPIRRFSISLGLKLAGLILLILVNYGIYFANTQAMPQLVKENELLKRVWSRVSIEAALVNPRISGWKVSLEALKARPILGYGPGNFSIGFDKFYDPALPKIQKTPPGGGVASWWDRAHNFIFDIGLTGGVLALIIYLALFGVLFFQLQKLKYYPNQRMISESTNNAIIAHGIQATFLAYLVANFFSFDTFSTYLISFLLIGYSLHLINYYPNATNLVSESTNNAANRRIKSESTKFIKKWRSLIIFLLFVGLVWFVWVFNIKPLEVNKEINLAKYESERGYCQRALERMEKILPERSFLDNYLRLKYTDVIDGCIKGETGVTLPLVQKAREILKENIKIRPYYTRNWLLLGSYTNILIERETRPELVEGLKDEANSYFEKANQLSPKRQEVFTEWIKTDLLTGEYQKAKEKSQKCLLLNPKLGDCWWLMGLSQAYLKNFEKADYYINLAQEKGYNTQSENSWLQLTKVYAETGNYQDLVKALSKLVAISPGNPQYHASLAAAYQKTGEIEEAKKEALKVLELQPEARGEVEAFLETLK